MSPGSDGVPLVLGAWISSVATDTKYLPSLSPHRVALLPKSLLVVGLSLHET